MNIQQIESPQTSLWIDLDGVLADFSGHFEKVCGQPCRGFERQYGTNAFWAMVRLDPQFFSRASLLPDARELWSELEPHVRGFLTATPSHEHFPGAAEQKRGWVAQHFGSEWAERVQTVAPGTKADWATQGAILVDDWSGNRATWTAAGGIFVHHRSAADSIQQVRQLLISNQERAA